MKNYKNRSYTIGTASLVAGICLVAVTLLTAYANFGVIGSLAKDSDAAYNFSNSIGSVRIAIISLLLVAVLEGVIALSLYKVLAPVSKGLSGLAALFRLLYAGACFVAVVPLIRISLARGGDAYAKYVQSGYGGDYIINIEKNIDAFHIVSDATLFLLGAHLLLIGYLAYRARYIPKPLGILLAIVGTGCLVVGVAGMYAPWGVSGVTSLVFIGEIALIFWLLAKGRKLERGSRITT